MLYTTWQRLAHLVNIWYQVGQKPHDELGSTGMQALKPGKLLMQEASFQKSNYNYQRHQNSVLKKTFIPFINMGSLRHLSSICSQVTPLKHLKKENLKRLVLLTQVQYLQRWRKGPWRCACRRTTWTSPREQFAPSSIPGKPRVTNPCRAEGCGINCKLRRKLRLWEKVTLLPASVSACLKTTS